MATGPMEVARVKSALASRYKIERVLGQGGMATVYLAADIKHNRRVAVKVMRPELAATLGADRFLREVDIAAQLAHPHILPLHDSGEVDGFLYYVMPYVEGESLSALLKREKQLTLDDAIRLAREIAQALAYAHARGIIHRDIKPANVLLTDGHALVADFGIARAIGTGEALTATGIAIGTPHYMSPEQASGETTIDARSDIYALGAVMYEMVSGEPPFTGPTAQAVLARSLTETARPLSTVRPSIPAAVNDVVMKSLARNPADRYATIAEMGTALGAAADKVRSGTMPAAVPVETTSPLRIVSLFGLVALVVLGITWVLSRQAGLPSWMFVLSVVLLLAGLPILLLTGRVEAQAARGTPPSGLMRLLNWRNAVLGGVLAFAAWGTLAATMSRGGAAKGDGPVRLAVLPFRNQGDSSNAYFVDGIADQIRGKMTELGAVQVIARSSSDQYRGTSKSPEEIGRELRVQYLLSATVGTIRNADGSGRVQVIPELIDAQTGSVKWQQTFDAPLTDLFQVQTEIAVRVAGALDVALGTGEQALLAERPSKNLEAYDAFLKGEQARALTGAASGRRVAISYYEQAVALDSSFALAWSRLSQVWTAAWFSYPSPQAAENARMAAERAAALHPGSPESHVALGDYYRMIRNDMQRAQQEYSEGLRIAPNHVPLLIAIASAERQLGRFAESIEPLQRAISLDPRSAAAYRALGVTFLSLRRYPEAISASDQAIALQPGNTAVLGNKVMIYLAQGDLPGARAVIRAAPREITPTNLAAYFVVTNDLYWVLEKEHQDIALRLPVSGFDDDVASRALAFAGIYHERGDRVRTRAYGDSAHLAHQENLSNLPDDNYLLALDAVALAFAGRYPEALRAGERSLELLPIEKDYVSAAYNLHQLIRVYILAGEKDKAVEGIRKILSIPYVISPGWLRVDPTFDPLRGYAPFDALTK
jgi:TolB-like protein/tRNA A-37 threonylcarbamoyl transferase component Bud32/cytochrome c-type biogenesis protein CcmH/NrfG